MTERELKLCVGTELTALALDLLIEEAGISVLARETRKQRDRYFDTKELVLAANGAALRTREHAGAGQICWKGRGSVQGALHEREEIEIEWPLGAEPRRASELPDSLRDRVEPFTFRERLRPLVTFETTRQVRKCASPDGREIFEVALDEVVAECGDGERHEFREVEIEGEVPPGGTAIHLQEVLTRRAGATPSVTNKVQRALALCKIAVPEASSTMTFPVTDQAGAAAHALLCGCARVVAEQELFVRTSADPEAVHKLRVACRRFRSALRLVADLYAKRQKAPIEKALQALGKALGRVRDLDVRALELERVEPEMPQGLREPMRRVRTSLELLRAEEFASLRAWLASEARLQAMEKAAQRLAERPDGARAEAELVPFLNARISALAQDVFERGDALGPAASPDELHDLRIAIKRLRYALEFGADVLPEPTAEIARRCAKLQGWLGTCNDAVTAQVELPEQIPLHGDEDLALAHALALQRRAARQAKARFLAAWPEFATLEVRARLVE